jgi:hypothetical protein
VHVDLSRVYSLATVMGVHLLGGHAYSNGGSAHVRLIFINNAADRLKVSGLMLGVHEIIPLPATWQYY